jgi:hypothetical protein
MASLRPWRALAALTSSVLVAAAVAQPPGPPQAPRSPRAAAQADLTGNWVAQITEDWRWRMITPPKGDYASVPLNPRGRQAADAWDPAADAAAGEACRAFGAGGLMRLPTRLKIAWQDDTTLQIETDAGQQVRALQFGAGALPAGPPSWQGHSVAAWIGAPAAANPFGGLVAPTQEAAAARGAAPPAASRGGPTAASGAPAGPRGDARPAPPAARGSLKVVTTNLRPGYLRKNGVPYSDRAVVTEYYDRFEMFGHDYLQVVTVVDDPVYLTTPFVVSNQFKREADDSKWNPRPCSIDPPVGTFQPPAR